MAKISARGDELLYRIEHKTPAEPRNLVKRGVITKKGRILIHNGSGYNLYAKCVSSAAALRFMELRDWRKA